jgi:hypothetical protein
MGLETRRGRSYYYRKERRGERVVSVYGGRGEIAGLLADLQALETARATGRRRQRQQERAEIEAHDPALAALERALRTLTQAVLVANGYHAHNRQWRRKRAQNESPRRPGGPQ